MEIATTENFFDEFADRYDLEFVEYKNSTLIEVKNIFEKYSYKSGNILDLGCGTGLLSEALGSDFEYTGVDISSNMLKRASARGYKKVTKNSIEDFFLSLKNEEYDFVVAFGVLYYIEDVGRIIQQMKRFARQAVYFDLCILPPKFIQRSSTVVYDHSNFPLLNATEDYRTFGWTSPTQRIPIDTRMVLLTIS